MSERIDSFSDGHRFLSNFYPSKVKWEGVVYPSVEHAFQSAKTLSTDARKQMAELGSPGEAKKWGRGVALRPDWERVKQEIMLQLLMQKFTVHEDLRLALLATGDAELVEGNTWGDRYWGVVDGQGENWLGKTLMYVRDRLREVSGIAAGAAAFA